MPTDKGKQMQTLLNGVGDVFALNPDGGGLRDVQSHKNEPLVLLGIFFKNAF